MVQTDDLDEEELKTLTKKMREKYADKLFRFKPSTMIPADGSHPGVLLSNPQNEYTDSVSFVGIKQTVGKYVSENVNLYLKDKKKVGRSYSPVMMG